MKLSELSFADLDSLASDLFKKPNPTKADQKKYNAIIKIWCDKRDQIDYGIEKADDDDEELHKTNWIDLKKKP